MTLLSKIETRSAIPLETRDEPQDDPLAQATAAVEELRAASETFRTEQTAAAERHATETRALTDRIAGLETRLNRPGTGTEQRANEPTVEQRAFTGFVRRGRESLAADEVRALRVDAQTNGGYLTPDGFEAELLRGLVQVSPIRQAARVTATTVGSVILPVRTSRLAASWVGETETRPASEPAYGQREIEVAEAAVFVDVSTRLLEDSALDIEAELRFDFVEEFGRLEGAAFVNGDGVKKPFGILADPDIPAVLNGHASTLQPDALIKLMYALPAYYRNRGAWLMNGAAIGTARLLKDTAGRFLWQESLAEGQPATLLGRPVIEAPDMPDVAANATPIVFGDIGSAYRIIDRVGLSVLRDPYTVAVNGLVRFHARRRVGGRIVRPEALRKLRIATA